MSDSAAPLRAPAPSVHRVDDALLLTGDAVEAVRWLLHVTIAARRRVGRDVPPSIREFARQVSAHGQIVAAAPTFGNARTDTVGVGEFAQITGLSPRQARRIAATIGRREAGRWVIDTDTAHTYARSRTA